MTLEAMQQALDALELSTPLKLTQATLLKHEAAADALRASLAQPSPAWHSARLYVARTLSSGA